MTLLAVKRGQRKVNVKRMPNGWVNIAKEVATNVYVSIQFVPKMMSPHLPKRAECPQKYTDLFGSNNANLALING